MIYLEHFSFFHSLKKRKEIKGACVLNDEVYILRKDALMSSVRNWITVCIPFRSNQILSKTLFALEPLYNLYADLLAKGYSCPYMT